MATQEYGKIIKGKKKIGGIEGYEEVTFQDDDGLVYIATIDEFVTAAMHESDPIFIASPAFNITLVEIINWNTAYGWGDHVDLYSLLGHTHIASNITDFDSAVAANSAVVLNTAKITNAIHTGDVTGSSLLTIQPDVVTYDKIQDMTIQGLLGTFTSAGTVEELSVLPSNVMSNINITASQISNYTSTLAGTTNTTIFTPTADYHVGTKKYIDDSVAAIEAYKINSTSGNSFASFEPDGTNEYLTVKGTDSNLIAEFLDISDNQIFTIANTGAITSTPLHTNIVTSNVNYLDITGSATTDAVIIAAEGTDTDIDLDIKSKGVGSVNIYVPAAISNSVLLNVGSNLKATAFQVDEDGDVRMIAGGMYIEAFAGAYPSLRSTSNNGITFNVSAASFPNSGANRKAPYQFYSSSGGKLTSTTAEQSWISVEAGINQSGIAAYNGLKIDVTETALGDGSSGDGNNLLNLAVGGTSLFRISNTGYIDLALLDPIPSHSEGRYFYDKMNHAMTIYSDISDTSLQVGHEQWFRAYNNSGGQLDNGSFIYISGEIEIDLGYGLEWVPTVAYAIANDATKALGIIGSVTHNVLNNNPCIITTSGKVRDFDTSGMVAGTTAYLSATIPGFYQDTPPPSPNYVIKVGQVSHSHATEGTGEVLLQTGTNTQDVIKIFNGAILEDHAVTVTSDSADVTLTLDNADAVNDLSLFFNGVFYVFTAPASIILTAGSDSAPTENYIYIPESTRVLTVSTVGWPGGQYVAVATVVVQSATGVQNDGAYKVHAWTDHLADSSNGGHLAHLNKWIRNRPVSWDSGVAQTTTIVINGGAIDNVYFATTSGSAYQLHNHAFPALDMQTGTPIWVVNDFTTKYDRITDLSIIDTDSTGATLRSNNTYYSIFVWGAVNEDATDCKYFCNAPSGFYTNETSAISDISDYTDQTIPREYRGVGFPIARIVLRYQTGASGTFTEILTENLLDSLGGGGGSAIADVEHPDNLFRVFNVLDNTKELAFDVSGLTTATTRTLAIQDIDGTVALITDANKVKVTVDDTNSSYLAGSIAEGVGIKGTVLNPAANESLEIAIDSTYVFKSSVGTENWFFGNAGQNDNFTGSYNIGIGNLALDPTVTASVTQTIAIGTNTLSKLVTGTSVVGLGTWIASNATDISETVLIGTGTGNSLSTGHSGDIFIGHNAGWFETGSDKLLISSLTSIEQVDEATARTKALIYGVNDTATANQILAFNAKVGIGIISPDALLSLAPAASVEGEAIRLNRNTDGFRFNSIMNLSTTSTNSYIKFNIHDGVTDSSQAEVMILKGDGNVGINNNSPGSKLSVVGLPTSNGSLSTGDFFTQTATELGGSGTTKVVCVV